MVLNMENGDQLDQKRATREVEAAVARLTNEDLKLGDRLINAAVAGAVVARQPADMILRAEAAEAWNSIRPVIANHLICQKDIVLPWAESRKDFPPDLILRAREQRTRLCGLGKTIDAASFMTGTDDEVAKAGTALTDFPGCL